MWNDPLKLLDVTLPSAEENLALDEALLLMVEQQGGPSYLRLWEWPHDTVVAGRSSRIFEEVNIDACRRDGVPILRRCSGGGVVLIGEGCVVFTLVLPTGIDKHLCGIDDAIAAILQRMIDALEPSVPGITASGTSDLAIDGRKVSGNSQRWLRRTLLHHGTLLYDFSIERMSRYLRLPKRQPEYRQKRSHEEFLTNLPIGGDQLRQLLTNAWQAQRIQSLLPYDVVSELANNKYRSETWNLRC